MLSNLSDCGSYDKAEMTSALRRLRSEKPTYCKGIPSSFAGSYADLGQAGLSLTSACLPMPVALLRQDVIRSNRAWMQQFLAMTGTEIAPHGKTTMSPDIVADQMADGSWGLTVATAQQLSFFADLGIRRMILANQLVGKGNIDTALRAAARHEDLEFHCIVDSAENIRMLADEVRHAGGRPINVLVEIGTDGGRTGLRNAAAAVDLARLIDSQGGALRLTGIEAYEGILSGSTQHDREKRVENLLETVRTAATLCDAADLFHVGEILLTAGGTEFFDMAAIGLSSWATKRKKRVVIRSGCYITSDSVACELAHRRMVERLPGLARIEHSLSSAIEVWATIQSNPEQGLAFATLGKRDISHDWHMPVALKWLRPGVMALPQPLPRGHEVTKLNDQHAFLAIPENSPLEVGDLVGFGVSHACTTFDKWRTFLVVDDQYRVTDAVRTFF